MNSTQRLTTRIGNWIGSTAHETIKSICDYIKRLMLETTRSAGNFALEQLTSMLSGFTGFLSAGIAKAEGVMYAFRVIISLTDFLDTIFTPFLQLNPQSMLKVTFGFNFYKRLSILCINLYDLCKAQCVAQGLPVREEPPEIGAVAQSGESSLLMNMALSMLLPPGLKYILKDFSIFSNFKLLDDCSVIFDFISLFFRIPLAIYKYFLPNETTLPKLLQTLEVYFPFGSFGSHKWKLTTLLDKLEKKPILIGDSDFQSDYQKAHKGFTDFLAQTWDNKKDYPNFLQPLLKKSNSVLQKILYMQDSQRQEPAFFVFYGRPGTGKTTMMNQLVKLYSQSGSSVYVHSTSSDSKDFHDQYDNEYLYVADDVGQKGVWQWSGYINMVSTTKYPLECAVAEKKDTKFFTSKVIFCTTNLIELTLTADCGLTDLGALHRRMELLDFSDVNFVDGVYSGVLHLKKYNLPNRAFELLEDINLTNVELPVIYTQVDRWMKNTVMAKARVHNVNALPNFSLNAFPEAIDDLGEVLVAGVLTAGAVFVDFCKYLKDEMCAAMQHILEYFRTNASEQLVIGVLCLTLTIMAPLIKGFIGLGEKIEYETPKTVKEIPRLYKADRKEKISMLKAVPQSLLDVFSIKKNVSYSSLTRLERQTYGVQCIYMSTRGQVTSEFCSVFSGQYFTAPAHGVLNTTPDIYVNVYKSSLNRIYDHVKVTKVFENTEDDLCILKLPDRLPVYTRNIIFAKDTQNPEGVLITPGAQNRIATLRRSDLNVSYMKVGFENVIPKDEALLYEFHASSLCGCMTVSPDAFLLGHHVAYAESIGSGVIRLFSAQTRKMIADFFSRRIDFFMPLKDEEVIGSKAVLDLKNYSLPNSNNTIVPSLVHGIFEKERVPAQFSDKPLKLIKKFSDLACENTATPSIEGLRYAHSYATSLMNTSQRFQKWSNDKVISGGGLLNNIDKRTSVGFGLKGVKEDYINYDSLEFKKIMEYDLERFEKDILDGRYPNFFFAEQFKQELRDEEKALKPRIFKMSPLVHTILIRRYFGDFLVFSHNNRQTTGVAVGINPFSDDWEKLMRQVTRHGDNVFGLDFEKYDKRMLSAFQQSINDVILQHCDFTDRDRKIAEFLLNSIFMTPCVVVDVSYITTHSLASGGALTAEYNSWIHKMYMAYAFHNLFLKEFDKRPTLYDYINNVENVTYGDDGLTGVSNTVKPWYNGPSVSNELALLGLAATTETKGVFDYLTRSIGECSFLKRKFVFHRGLCRIVAPLDLKSVKSTLNYVKDDFRNEELTQTKLQNFQREVYLHENQYPSLLDHCLQFCKEHEVQFTPLCEQYLKELYETGKFSELMFLGSI